MCNSICIIASWQSSTVLGTRPPMRTDFMAFSQAPYLNEKNIGNLPLFSYIAFTFRNGSNKSCKNIPSTKLTSSPNPLSATDALRVTTSLI